MATTEPEVNDERGMGWPHYDGQGGIHDRLLDPCGRPPMTTLRSDETGDAA